MAAPESIQSKNGEYLLENGPSPPSELPYKPSAEQRERSIRTFNVTGSQGNSENLGAATRIVYLDDYHTPKDVLKAWKEYNNTILQKNARALHIRISRNHSEEFKQASREVFGDKIEEAYSESGGNKMETGGIECHLCGEEYDRYLPDHLPECEGI